MNPIKIFLIAVVSILAVQVRANNVILIIGDGMDDQQITAARNYLYGAQGLTVLDTMPIRSAMQVLSVSDENPQQPVYVADSANTASAMATGVVTSRGRIATSAKSNEDLKTIIELAQEAGLKTGIVSTSSLTDATPASFVAHVNQRGCQSPMYMVQFKHKGDHVIDCSTDIKKGGGKGSIAEQLASSRVDVLLGGGLKFFQHSNEADEKTILQEAEEQGFAVVQTLGAAAAVDSDKKLLGLFAEKHLAVRWQGSGGRGAEKAEMSFLNMFHRYLGSVTLPEVMTCVANPEYIKQKTPQLKDLTSLALQRLNNGNGFFLMVESASIDKESHYRRPCGSIGESEQLFETVQVALDFAKQHKDTLVLITADHGQAAQIVPNGSLFDVFGVPVASPGSIARIQTPEGGIMAINYATNEFQVEEHTGVNVPLFANQQVQNAQGEKMISTLIKQPDIFEISKVFLGL